jgi:hypothetical protein
MIEYSEALKTDEGYKTTFVFYKYVNYLHEYHESKSESDKSKILGNILTLFESKKDLIKEEIPNEEEILNEKMTTLKTSKQVMKDMKFNGTTLLLSKCNPTFISCTLFFIEKDMTGIVLYLLRLLFFKYNIYKEKPRTRRYRYDDYYNRTENTMALNDYNELKTLYERYVNKNDNFENIMFVTFYLSIY